MPPKIAAQQQHTSTVTRSPCQTSEPELEGSELEPELEAAGVGPGVGPGGCVGAEVGAGVVVINLQGKGSPPQAKINRDGEADPPGPWGMSWQNQ